VAKSPACYNESQFTAAVLPLLQNCDETSNNVTYRPIPLKNSYAYHRLTISDHRERGDRLDYQTILSYSREYFPTDMSPYEFVCLEHNNVVLYAEIIQVLEQQQRYWIRPVLLCESKTSCNADITVHDREYDLYDVRYCSDLIWPKDQFRRVYDTELIPLLRDLTPDPMPIIQLQHSDNWPTAIHLARRKLNTFIQDLWETNAFQRSFRPSGI
jgi:hypothetical protein